MGAVGSQICEIKSILRMLKAIFGQYQGHKIIVDVENGHLLCVGEEILKVSLYIGLTQVSINQTGHWSGTWRLFSHLKIQKNTLDFYGMTGPMSLLLWHKVYALHLETTQTC